MAPRDPRTPQIPDYSSSPPLLPSAPSSPPPYYTEDNDMPPPPLLDQPSCGTFDSVPQCPIVLQQPKSASSVVYKGVAKKPIQVHVHQPSSGKLPKREWMSDVFGCCDDMSTCCSVMCCYPCMACSMASRMKESCWIPICCPGGLTALRLKLRTEQNIEGTLCNDYCMSSFCSMCVLCQMKREKDSLAKLELGKNAL